MKNCPYPELPKCRQCIARRYRVRGDWSVCEGCYIDAFNDRENAATCRLQAMQYLIRCWERDLFKGDVVAHGDDGMRFVEKCEASMKYTENWAARIAKLAKLKSPTELRQVMCDLMTEYYGTPDEAQEWFRILRFHGDPWPNKYVPSKRRIV